MEKTEAEMSKMLKQVNADETSEEESGLDQSFHSSDDAKKQKKDKKSKKDKKDKKDKKSKKEKKDKKTKKRARESSSEAEDTGFKIT